MQLYLLPPQTVRAWQFDPQRGDTSDQPEFVTITRQMAGPAAIARPPGSNVVLTMEPGEWLVQLPQGGWTTLPPQAMEALDTQKIDDEEAFEKSIGPDGTADDA